MHTFGVGDLVARKSYGGDILFKVADTISRDNGKKRYILKGLLYRIEADADEEDLLLRDKQSAYMHMYRSLASMGLYSRDRVPPSLRDRIRKGTPGLVLHIDSSEEYLDMCVKYYRKSNIRVLGKVIPENEQPRYIRQLLESTKADIIVITGHDGIRKNAQNLNSIDSYRNSKYYIQSTREARKYQPDFDKLCIFSGACQSYFEGIMSAGANFASSPGRVLIHALDPGKVGERVSLTDSSRIVTAEQIAEYTQSGMKGIGGIRTKGHYTK
jgi:spore coat assembly protein